MPTDLADHLRAIASAPLSSLDTLSRAIWVDHGEGRLSDDAAQSLAEAVQARRTAPRYSETSLTPRRSLFPPKRPQRTPDRAASRYRRRSHARARWVPDHLAAGFTDGELAALSIIAQEHAARGRCAFPMAKIAALAGISETTARNAFREAKAQGLITVEERPQHRAPHLPNIIRIVAPAWKTWIERRPATWRGGGCKELKATPKSKNITPLPPLAGAQRNRSKGYRPSRAEPGGSRSG
jgi:hypothetical protein